MQLLEDKRNIDYLTLLNAVKNNDSKAVLLIQLRNWLFKVLEFDPNTGEPLFSDMTSFLDKVSELIPLEKEALDEIKANKSDWLYKSLSYNKRSLLYLLGNPRNEIIRSHERMNIYQAREIDSAGIMEISRRPGRTVREKVAVKPTILAVKREQGADTLENRLLKKYLTKLLNVLEERQKCFNELGYENEDSNLSRIYSIIRRWLKSEDADTIGKWQNLPPNNILLHDKNYKKIWKGWQFLLDLDELVLNDWNNIDRLLTVYIFWKTLSILHSKGSKIKQTPLDFDYEKFEICNVPFKDSDSIRVEAEDFILELKKNTIIVISSDEKEHVIEIHFNELIVENKIKPEQLITLSDADKISVKLANSVEKRLEQRTIPEGFMEEQKYSAINFSEYPYSAISVSNSDLLERRNFSTRLARQFWTENSNTEWLDIETSLSPSTYSDSLGNYKIESVTFEDVFFDAESLDLSEEKQASAAYDFMNTIRNFYNTDKLYYLLPDYLEEFSLSRIRSTANTVFPSANPIPNSIGTVFSFHHSEQFKTLSLKENDFVFVIEKSTDNKVFAITPIQVKTTFELSTRKILKLADYPDIPNGIRWEHHPAVIFENYEPAKVMDYIQKAVSETEGHETAEKIVIISGQKSIEKARLELPKNNWFFFDTPFEASEGAVFCAQIQEKVKEIPMWSEHLPVLQMTYLKNGKRSGSNLTYGKTVLPIRGQRQRIEIPEKFILNKNVKTYHFRLSRGGEGTANSLRYEACLSNSAFPLKNNTECKLEMYYIYGEEQPFELYFVPVNSSEFIRAKVEWRKVDENSFPVPNFPPLRTWQEFEKWENVRTKKINNLITWNIGNLTYINELKDFCNGELNNPQEFVRYTIKVPQSPKFLMYEGKPYIGIPLSNNKIALLNRRKLNYILGPNDTYCSFSINPKKELNNHYYLAVGLSGSEILTPTIFKSLWRRMRFPAMQIWNNRRTINAEDVPNELTFAVSNIKETLDVLLQTKQIKEIPFLWNELLLLACVMHIDGLDIVKDYILVKLNTDIDFNQRWQDIELLNFQLGYCIDDAETEVQNKVFEWAIDFNGDLNQELLSFKLQVLTIALWRNELLLSKISFEKMQKLLSVVVKVITEEFVIAKKKQKVDDEDFAKHFNRNMNPLRSHLELLCALIRSRNMGEKFQQLFSPYSKEIQKLIKTIEEIYEWLNPLLRKHNKIFFTKQIKFSSSDTTNSFLEYLLLWLDGQNSTKMPKIESATDDDSSDSVDESLDEE